LCFIYTLKRDPNRDVDYIVTAAGGRGLYGFNERGNNTLSANGFDVKYFGFLQGFVMLEFEKQTVSAEFIDMEGDVRYSFTREH